jgi:hypothetical protein
MTKRVTTRRKGAPIVAQPAHTIVEFILDETGSMQSCKPQTLSGFNSFLAEQRATPGSCLLTLTKFDTSGLKTPYVDLDVNMVPNLTENTFIPGQSTNLYDAIGERVEQVKNRLSSYTTAPHVLVVVLTDGEDNASRRYNPGTIRETIRTHEAEGWTFVYLGATPNALRIAEMLGFQAGNAKAFDAREIHQTMTDLAAATVAYRTARAAGQVTASTSFFADNR